MEFLAGFAWAVPLAFHDALDLCRFERGDTLYDAREAYGPDWDEARGFIHHSIQVRSPDRAMATEAPEGRSVFKANWSSEVRLDLYEDLKRVGEDVPSTQGRLYTLLWKGDTSVLHLDHPEPPPPIGWRDLLSHLETIRELPEVQAMGGRGFVMPYDQCSALSKKKYADVESALSSHLSPGVLLLSPEDALIPDPEKVAPTVAIVLFPVQGLSVSRIEKRVKDALYKPTKGAKTVRFRISAHGCVLIPLKRSRILRDGRPVDIDGQPASLSMNARRRTDRAIQEMLGLAKGVIADGRVTPEEAEVFRVWVEKNPEVAGRWPGSVVAKRIRKVFSDGVVDREEREDLASLFRSLVGGNAGILAGEVAATELPFDDDPPAVTFEGKTFVLTGRFAMGPRKACEAEVLELGGACQNTVTRDTNYLVVGTFASRDWVQTSFGRKIEKAVEYRSRGFPLAIISEDHWAEALP